MTGSDAAKILEYPRFGDQSCIDAVRVMQIAEALLEARKWAHWNGFAAKVTNEYFGCIDTTTPVAAMEHFRIENELEYWIECGWRDEA
ncbi:MAG: hypothetical protein ACJ74Z_19890 [Bryobacteraceae bacterium]|jgi:hypothetical protein